MATKKKTASPAARPVYKSPASLLPWFGIALLVILFDQVTKLTVERSFFYGETRPITGFFNLIKVYNPGAAFSFLGDAGGWQRYFFTGIAIVAVGFILYLMKKHASQRLFCFALALIMGGAIGNVIDRLAYGHVIDFLDFYWKGVGHFPAFNIADIGISVGAVLFIVDELRRVNKS
ncbi:signal peptidase II [Massilia yuzhufengensis]|uniref:Lipoprotein signal peptidase n=1 Tax=Massilia yuzhufengensis TaxID=1164594 RepID=A0A1I1HUZ7_9BURK|nr:signal peptidase II [Massilia yuzhufengensis]SFC27711.1 signal peptidase II Aspartic peptidase. MEROPS family A08 [Massilia yuzhufengensis]